MKLKDIEKIGKVDNEQPENGFLPKPLFVSKLPSGQEYHNAGHALWYLSTVAHGLIHEKAEWADRKKTERVVSHLFYLREFIRDEDVEFKSLVTRLLKAIVTEFPDDRSKWLRFIQTHWDLIRDFSARYGDPEECFPESDYKRICDIVSGRQWSKPWWWQLKTKKLFKEFTRTLKTKVLRNYEKSTQNVTQRPIEKTSEGFEAKKDIEGLFRAWFRNRMTVILMTSQDIRPRDQRTLLKNEFFLEDLEHHFIDSHAPKRIRNAFRYLKCYYKVYPSVTAKHSERVIEMVRRIYEAMGYEFRY